MINTITIGPFDIYSSFKDKAILGEKLSAIYNIHDELLIYMSREESLTSEEELAKLRMFIFDEMESIGEIKYLRKLNYQKFDAIAKVRLEANFSKLIISMMKYFFSFSFFKPLTGITLEQYNEYISTNGFNDVNGHKLIKNKLTDLVCIKGYDGDHLIISYDNDICLPENLTNHINKD